MSPSGLQTLEEFLADDPRRRDSQEVDFGVRWRSGSFHWPVYRVSWIASTREVYAVAMNGQGLSRTVIVLGSSPNREAILRALDGWTDQVGKPDGLLWVRERLLEAAIPF